MDKVVIVGGSIGKPSGVIHKVGGIFNEIYPGNVMCYNGLEQKLPEIGGYTLAMWWPDIDNKTPKTYPRKDKGAVLICSKVMRPEVTKIEALTRIFRMSGNAVVLIRKENSPFNFELVDALNNTWVNTQDLKTLSEAIDRLYRWSRNSVRKSLVQSPDDYVLWMSNDNYDIPAFMQMNSSLAEKITNQCGSRFFGNFSTRCTKLFPSLVRTDDHTFMFSPRNSDKRSLTLGDMVLTTTESYYGSRKPSVDTPVQIDIYKARPEIKFMIHGHATITNAPTTREYFPCGDMREVPGVLELLQAGHKAINLKNHGFLIVASNLTELANIIKESTFKINGDK